MDKIRIALYRNCEIRLYRRRSKKYKEWRPSYITRPDGSQMDLVAMNLAHLGESESGNRIVLRSNLSESFEKSIDQLMPLIDADLDDLVWCELQPDLLNGAADWMPRSECKLIDLGKGLRKYWISK